MSGSYQVIDEISYNVLGTFDSRGEAIDFVAKLLSMNDESFLNELTVAGGKQKRLTGDSLRSAVSHRTAARDRV